jgi:abhydrolase domain-containing protein 6
MKKLLFGLILLLSATVAALYFTPAAQLTVLRWVEQYRAGLTHEQLTVSDLNIHYYQGGHIAALFAARYPDRVHSLALFGNAGIDAPRQSELYQRLRQDGANPLVVRKIEDFQALLEFVFVEPPYLPESLKTHLAERAMANAAHYDRVFEQLVNRYIPLEHELPKISAPTLILWGKQDRVLDVSSIEVMQPLLRKPSVVIMDNVGHAPMLERPEESALLYRRFLADLKPDDIP